MTKRILIVDDDVAMCEMIQADLKRRGIESRWVLSGQDALEQLQTQPFAAVLTDLKMPGMNGLELCENIAGSRPDIPVVVLTAFGSLDSAVGAIRAGAFDFVTKPIELDLLAIAIERALRHHSLQDQIRLLEDTVKRYRPEKNLIGNSPPMQALNEQLHRIAATDVSVLITGESGTGKELVARALHHQSHRKQGPFLAVNCSALPETLLESELFGHAKGAFTDARQDHPGLFVEASQGTLFLDEIGDVPAVFQPKLLRALEERTVRPVGGLTEVPFDVRLITATNCDLEAAVGDGQFREDLFFRINVLHLHLPPLRDRGTDILLLAQRFVEQFSSQLGKPVEGISESVAEKLLSYKWPGNVRELRNVIERAVALTRYEKLLVEDLPKKLSHHQPSYFAPNGSDYRELVTLEEMEKRYLLHVLQAVQGNRSRAARILGLDRKTLYRRLQRYGELLES